MSSHFNVFHNENSTCHQNLTLPTSQENLDDTKKILVIEYKFLMFSDALFIDFFLTV